MKQHITAEQILQLSPAARATLREWWQPRPGDRFFDPRLARTDGRAESGAGVICSSAFPGFAEYEPVRHDGVFGRLESSETAPATTRDTMLPLLSIGQLCAMLTEGRNEYYFRPALTPELCDRLWMLALAQLEARARTRLNDEARAPQMRPHG